jgi:hypothetical protein
VWERTDGAVCAFYSEVVITRIGKEYIMGKYFLGWLLGVPAIVLVLLYLVFH